MAVELNVSGTRYRWRGTYDLDGVEVTIAWWWSPARPPLDGATEGAWYADIYTADGDLAASGCRVTPGGLLLPDRTYPGLPGGDLLVTGRDPYLRGDLGTAVRVFYAAAGEVVDGG